MAGDADEPRPPARMIGLPTLHPHLPYRSPQHVTGEGASVPSVLQKEDDSPAESLEELMRRLRELCRVMAYVSTLEDRCATSAASQEISQKHAEASRSLECMFRRAAIDLRHIARTRCVDEDENEE